MVIAKNFMDQDLSLVMPILKILTLVLFRFHNFHKMGFEFCSLVWLWVFYLLTYLLTFCFV